MVISNIRDAVVPAILIFLFFQGTLILLLFQGELGAQGLVGPRGPPGEGLPGAKVRVFTLSGEKNVEKGFIHFFKCFF